jgi:hypothetical protein
MATVSMTEGAKLVGRSKGTLSKAVASGKLSYIERTANGYLIDTSELFRAFPPKQPETVVEARLETPKETPPDRALVVEIQMLREQMADLRSDRDAWRDQAQRLLLEGPKPPETAATPETAPETRPRWRFWRREGDPL